MLIHGDTYDIHKIRTDCISIRKGASEICEIAIPLNTKHFN